MKLLVLGCNGMAGHVISLYLKENGHQVIGFARQPSLVVDAIIGDVHNLDFIRGIVRTGEFHAVINCIGILNQFAEDNKDNAVFLNSYLPHFLAECTKDTQTVVVHISTDCVFSGKNGPYRTNSLRDGESFYDRSKALGELEDNKNITLRNSIVGPDLNADGIGLLNWFMKQDESVNGYTGSIWTGLTTLQLAKTIEVALMQEVTGLLHAVPRSSISKYELLMLFNKYLRREAIDIQQCKGVEQDKTLLRENDALNYTIPSYDQMVSDLAEWMFNHRVLYPHYKLRK